MNQRIQELIKQAGTDCSGKWMGINHAEKFAELIVQECVKVVDAMADPEDSERYFWAIQNASTKIKEHFGVEE